MVVFVWLGSPFAVAAVLAAVWPRSWRRWVPLLGLGVVLACGFVVYAYFSAAPDYARDRNGCSDCGEYLGRWWEPSLVAFFAVGGYLAWVVGLAVGALVRLVTGET